MLLSVVMSNMLIIWGSSAGILEGESFCFGGGLGLNMMLMQNAKQKKHKHGEKEKEIHKATTSTDRPPNQLPPKKEQLKLKKNTHDPHPHKRCTSPGLPLMNKPNLWICRPIGTYMNAGHMHNFPISSIASPTCNPATTRMSRVPTLPVSFLIHPRLGNVDTKAVHGSTPAVQLLHCM